MNGVRVDPAARRAVYGGGTTWGGLDAATQQHGLAVPGGFVSHTGIAGLTLGGGIGWLTKKVGLTCDNLVAAEVVTAESRIVCASQDEQAELFWALRGGGGNFGVVTYFEFALHEVGPIVNIALFLLHPDTPGRSGGLPRYRPERIAGRLEQHVDILEVRAGVDIAGLLTGRYSPRGINAAGRHIHRARRRDPLGRITTLSGTFSARYIPANITMN